MRYLRSLSCFFGIHRPQIIRTVFWGNCHHAELKCVCGQRFEGLVAGPVGYVKKFDNPTDWWVAYDSGFLPEDPARETR